jgi:hypothetical protein
MHKKPCKGPKIFVHLYQRRCLRSGVKKILLDLRRLIDDRVMNAAKAGDRIKALLHSLLMVA